MIYIYTTTSCSGCRKAVSWLDDHHYEYVEKNIFQKRLTKDDLVFILNHTDNGFDDIISKRSKIIKESKIDVEDMTFSELIDFIINNPSVLRRPIMVDDGKLQVGYNEDDIRMFIPRDDRYCKDCGKYKTKDCYSNVVVQNLKEIRDNSDISAK